MNRHLGVGILILSISAKACANEVVTVPPAGVRTWAEMVAADEAMRATGIAISPSPAQPPMAISSFVNSKAVRAQSTERFSIGLDAGESGTERSACLPCPGNVALTYGFEAQTGTANPPYAMGAVGPNHVVTMPKTDFRVHDRSGAILSSVSLASFWSLIGPAPFEERILFDSSSNRWLASARLSGATGFAISSTDNPLGAWTFYSLPDAGPLETFPCMGYNSTWIAITADIFTPAFQGPAMWVIDKSTALSGGPLTLTFFPAGFDGNTTIGEASLQPCVTFDAGEPTLWIVNLLGLDPNDDTNLIRLSQITGTGPSPAWSVVPGSDYPGTGLFRVNNVFSYTNFGGANCNAVEGLRLLGARIAANTVFRNGRLWATHHAWLPATGTPNHAAAFWYEIDPGAMPNPIVQSGVIDGVPGSGHVCPSIAVNCTNDVCVGMTRSDPVRCPEAAFATRFAGDPPGYLSAAQTLRVATHHFVPVFEGPFYWGNYSATVVDPIDDRGFWTIQEYVGPTYLIFLPSPYVVTRWGLWWGRITQDCNLNGVADLCDGVVTDCNSNGISDFCECDHCDFTGDGKLNATDIRVFVDTLVNQPSCAGAEFLAFCRADMNRDGVLSSADIPPFVQQLIYVVNCPE
ncbi:MAG: hypothetical protein HZA51_07925 [Planctomycetes bacterium]|nr:hypothetical protein [Planctomycetota bacterium]